MEDLPEVATAVAGLEIVNPPAQRGKPVRPAAEAESRTFDARMEALPATAAFVEGFCARHGVDTADMLRLTLVVEELFTNVVVHGYGRDTGGAIRLDLALDGRDVSLTCRDEAPPFDPRPALERLPADLGEPVETRRIGGLGHLLVGRLVDVAGYVRAEGANVLTLRLRRSAGSR